MTSIAPERTSASADFQRLLAGVRLGDIELVDIHAQRLGVDGIQRVLRVDEGRRAAQLLRLARCMCSATVVLPEDSGP